MGDLPAAGCARVKKGDGPQVLAQLPWWSVRTALTQERLEELKEGRGGALFRCGRALDWEGMRPSCRGLWKQRRGEERLRGLLGDRQGVQPRTSF